MLVELLDRQDRGDLFAVHERQQVDDGFPAAGAPALRHVVHLDPVQTPAIGEAQHVVVGIGDEQVVDEIVFLGRSGLLATTAALLRPVVGEWLGLHVAGMRQRHHHILGRDQVLHTQVLGVHHDFAAAFVAELAAGLRELVGDYLGSALRFGKDVEQVGNVVHDLFVLVDDLLPLQAGQALQLHFEDTLRLHLGESVASGLQSIIASQAFRSRCGHVRAFQHALNKLRVPHSRHQLALGFSWSGRGLDQRDDLIDVGKRHRKPFQDVAAFARLAQIENRATGNYFAPVAQEGVENLLQIEQAGLAVHQRHHVHPEGILHLRFFVQIVQDDFRDFAALELEHHAHAGLVGFVADFRKTIEALVPH